MQVISDPNEHLITIEDAPSGVLWHFASGKTYGFRFIGAQPATPKTAALDDKSPGYVSAEATAIDFARRNGWL